MQQRVHNNNAHHIHSLQDAIELLESEGFTPGVRYDDGTEFYIASKERAHSVGSWRFSVRVDKTGRLTVIRN